MKKYLSLIFVIVLLGMTAYVVIGMKNKKQQKILKIQSTSIGTFQKNISCAKLPMFLKHRHIFGSVVIDLSQKQYKGIAFLYGKQLEKVLHFKQWEQYGNLSTYSLNKEGDIFLVPMPYISIHPSTFNLQKNLYKLESQTGKLTLFKHFDDIIPLAHNPYGLQSVVFDCDDQTLWLSTIDQTDYSKERGKIYHIHSKTKETLQTINGFDALTLQLIKTSKGKYLLAGSAKDNGLYAYKIENNFLKNRPMKLLELPNSNEHIRKIKVTKSNTLELQTIPFTYTLIAQTGQSDRAIYHAVWKESCNTWKLTRENN